MRIEMMVLVAVTSFHYRENAYRGKFGKSHFLSLSHSITDCLLGFLIPINANVRDWLVTDIYVTGTIELTHLTNSFWTQSTTT